VQFFCFCLLPTVVVATKRQVKTGLFCGANSYFKEEKTLE
jgi:hypothetical protein